jgi:acyl carrier protein phosphodiesterase
LNYLAHIYLSGDSEEMIIGNFIGDYVKGQQFLNYPSEVSKGIILHRKIDTFTDSHPCIGECILKLRPVYGKYAGIVVDIFLDHFLVLNWSSYSPEELPIFTNRFHALLWSNFFQLPSQVKVMVPFLIRNKRLESYATLDGIEKTLIVMAKHTSLPALADLGIKVLVEEYEFFNNAFNRFFPELIQHVEQVGELKISRPLLAVY